MKNANRSQKTKYLTYSSVLVALGVVLLGVGAWFGTLDLTMAALASMLIIYAVIEIKGAYPWMTFVSTSFLSLLLLPQKSPAFLYLFIGYYPIVKEKIEGKFSRLTQILSKAACFHLSLAGMVVTSLLFFKEEIFAAWKWQFLVLYLFSFAAFWLYDFALTRFITFYLYKLHPRFRIK